MKNNKGFTMVELLAAMVILGLLTITAVPTVLNLMENNRRQSIISDASKFVSKVENLVANNNNTIKKPKNNGECIAISLAYIASSTSVSDTSSEFNEGPHGYPYDPEESYVIIKYNGSGTGIGALKYDYYVTLYEKTQEENGYYGVLLLNKNNLNKKSLQYISGLKREYKFYNGSGYLINFGTVIPSGETSALGCTSFISNKGNNGFYTEILDDE